MKVVILGAGVVGFQIASQLVKEGHDVVIIEKSAERAKHIANHWIGNNILDRKIRSL